MFSMKTLAQMASMGVNFPDVTTSATNMLYLGQQHITFAVPTFTLANIGSDAALISYNAQGQTFVFSAADHFWEVSNTYTNGLRSSIKSWATPLPAGWELLSILAVGSGINHTCDIWGQGLRGYYGKPLTSNQAEIPFRMFGYWTDHYSGYYYLVDPKYANYEEEMVAVKGHYDTLGIKLGYLMLDSWWYKKGCNQSWTNVGNGIYLYQASTAVFPSGLNEFHTRIGLPFVTHHRWYEASCSPIATTYGLSGGLPTKYAAWQDIIYHVADSGSITFEQDWLDNNALVAQHIGDLDSAMGNMAKVCAEKKMTQQYCMPLPMYYQQAAKYPTLTAIRSANDGYVQGYWNDHIFNSRFAWSMGLFPWVDCFPSTNNNTGCVVSCVVARQVTFRRRTRSGSRSWPIFCPRQGATAYLSSATYRRSPPSRHTSISDREKPLIRSRLPIPTTVTISRRFICGCPARPLPRILSAPRRKDFPRPRTACTPIIGFPKPGNSLRPGNPLTATCAAGTNAFHYWVVAPVGAFRDSLSRRFKQIHFMRQAENNVACSFRDASIGDGRSRAAGGYRNVKRICNDKACCGVFQ